MPEWPKQPNNAEIPLAEKAEEKKDEEIKDPKNSEKQDGVESADIVDLSNLKIDFQSDQKITEYYKIKLEEIEDMDKWLEKNKFNIERNKVAIALAVQQGLIKNDSIEAIWQFEIEQKRREQEGVIEVKNILEARLPEILKEISTHLGEFLPGWKLKWAKIEFKINEGSDYCINDFNFITADLGRLIHEDDFIENVTAGLAHEISHVWMNEKERKWDTDSFYAMKNQAKFGTMTEGLAVLFSKQDIRKMQIEKGRDYEEYSQESFTMLKKLLESKDLDEMDKIKEKGFKDTGYFYVAGYEMANKILERVGLDEFRGLLPEFRNNPEKFFDEYERCKE